MRGEALSSMATRVPSDAFRDITPARWLNKRIVGNVVSVPPSPFRPHHLQKRNLTRYVTGFSIGTTYKYCVADRFSQR